jgi:hypothetical protein
MKEMRANKRKTAGSLGTRCSPQLRSQANHALALLELSAQAPSVDEPEQAGTMGAIVCELNGGVILASALSAHCLAVTLENRFDPACSSTLRHSLAGLGLECGAGTTGPDVLSV